MENTKMERKMENLMLNTKNNMKMNLKLCKWLMKHYRGGGTYNDNGLKDGKWIETSNVFSLYFSN